MTTPVQRPLSFPRISALAEGFAQRAQTAYETLVFDVPDQGFETVGKFASDARYYADETQVRHGLFSDLNPELALSLARECACSAARIARQSRALARAWNGAFGGRS